MLTARGPNGRVNAWEVSPSDGPFSCLGCHHGTTLKKGHIRIAHFAHEPGSDCPYGVYHVNEGPQHYKAKKAIYDALSLCEEVTDLKLERYLGAVRPDISFRLNGVPVAVEMQVSKISLDLIVHRTKEYSRRGIYLLWTSPFDSESITSFHHYDTLAQERYIHDSLTRGVFYYWVQGATLRPVHFGPPHTGENVDLSRPLQQSMRFCEIDEDIQITNLEPVSLSVQYIEEPLFREVKLLSSSSVWLSQENIWLTLAEAYRKYPARFPDTTLFTLPPGVVPFTSDPFDEDAPFDPADVLAIPTGGSHSCPLHHRPYQFSDKYGNFYCNDGVCWSRYRFLSAGAERGYPPISVIYDPRDYLADTSVEPLYFYSISAAPDAPMIPVYPAHVPTRHLLVSAGEDAWKAFAEGDYWRIAMALKTLDSEIH